MGTTPDLSLSLSPSSHLAGLGLLGGGARGHKGHEGESALDEHGAGWLGGLDKKLCVVCGGWGGWVRRRGGAAGVSREGGWARRQVEGVCGGGGASSSPLFPGGSPAPAAPNQRSAGSPVRLANTVHGEEERARCGAAGWDGGEERARRPVGGARRGGPFFSSPHPKRSHLVGSAFRPQIDHR